MKVGILTFHRATNYGAILQAYALIQYLINQGYDARIVDYKPKGMGICTNKRSGVLKED